MQLAKYLRVLYVKPSNKVYCVFINHQIVFCTDILRYTYKNRYTDAVQLHIFFLIFPYNEILDSDWFSVCLFVT